MSEERTLTYEEKMVLERIKSDLLSNIAHHQAIVDSSSFMIVEHYQDIKHDQNRVMDWLERLEREISMRHSNNNRDQNLEQDFKCLSSLIAIDELRTQYNNIMKNNDIRGYSIG